ncbi:MAG TPA: sucrase ferredoxin, partial [Nocardioides sp.]|nr:sucrase ferredoxin [Nocardioides sp.]
PVAPWLETSALTDVHEVLDLDLAALGRGRSAGLGPAEGSLFCVCTHGKHDACCAERGRPVAAALEAAHPEETWEVTHIGGDRFAANMVVLPHGLYYGRLDPVAALGVAGTHLSGGLDLDHLRGRSGLGMPAQVAEIGLRRRLEEARNDAVRFLDATRDDDVTTARFDVAGTTYAVRVRTRRSDEQRLTCQAMRDNPVPFHDLLDVTTYS